MDMFNFLVIAAIAGLLYIVYDMFFKKPKGYRIMVEYSELIGNEIVESEKTHMGIIDEDNDTLIIPKLKIKRPVPPRHVMKPTFSGKKKVHLIKIGVDRYAFRIPTLTNEVLIYKRDGKGNILLNTKGKPIIVKHKWNLCDDVVEPDIKHWEEWMQEINRKNHEIKKDFLERWLAPLAIGMIFLFGMITMHQTSKMVLSDKQMILEKATEAEARAEKTTNNLNDLMESLTGKRILGQDENVARDDYQNTATT